MSYDIFVFDRSAPTDEDDFLEWYETFDEEEDHDASSPQTTSAPLHAFYDELRERFLPLNGPDAADEARLDEDVESIADYVFGAHAIYLEFRWGASERAREAVLQIAKRTDVGVYLCSDDESIIRPGEHGA